MTSVADDPDNALPRPGGRWLAIGVRDEVTIHVYVRREGDIATGYPDSGPGVTHNPREGA